MEDGHHFGEHVSPKELHHQLTHLEQRIKDMVTAEFTQALADLKAAIDTAVANAAASDPGAVTAAQAEDLAAVQALTAEVAASPAA